MAVIANTRQVGGYQNTMESNT